MSRKVSKKAEYLLYNLNISTHPDKSFVEWIDSEDKSIEDQKQELLDAGLVVITEEGLVPTKTGINYFRGENQDVKDVLQQIKNILPKNPSFEHITQNLTDTALMRLVYTCLGEIGRRGDPENISAYKMWNGKIKDLEKTIVGADPNSLWEKYTVKK
jgi:hypothetical protein